MLLVYQNIYITISTYTSVCPYGVRRPALRHVTSHFQFLSCSELQKPSQTAAGRGEAELRILDFKTSWSEFQKPSQTAAEQGEAELCILDFKTTYSEFQEPSQSAARQSKAELRILDFKTTWSEFHKPIRLLLSEAKLSYVYSILKPHGQSSRCQGRLLPPRRNRGVYTQF